jgi:hypothetical protein
MIYGLPENRIFQKRNAENLGKENLKDKIEEQQLKRASEPLREECFIADDEKTEEESPIHQQLLQHYMNFQSPYRGVLLYHSLGSGKTASSIGILEAMKTTGKVYIFTPAALEVNYRFEINKHAIRIFGQPYRWTFKTLSEITQEETSRAIGIKSQVEIIENLETMTGIPTHIIEEHKGIFIQETGEKGKSVKEMRETDPESVKLLEKQLIQTLLRQVSFIHYNGVKPEKLEAMNFEKATVVIDEVHNLISMIRNRGVLRDILLKKLMNYNTRIIALSGTPIINHPFEVAILLRILRGTIVIYRFPIQGSSEKRDETIEKEALQNPWVRWAGVDRSKGSRVLMIEPNPIGFLSWFSDKGNKDKDNDEDELDRYLGVYYNNDYQAINDEMLERFEKEMKTEFDIVLGKPQKDTKSFEWLPSVEKDFVEHYLKKTADGLMYNLFNRETLARRFLGMISYYQTPASGNAYPKANDEEVLKIPMSETQFGMYLNDRRDEIRREIQYKKRTSKNPLENPPSEYKTKTRHTCNAIFPLDIVRPGSNRAELRRRQKEPREIQKEIQAEINVLMTKLRTKEEYKMLYVRESRGGFLKEYCPKMEELLKRMDGGDPQKAKMSLIYSQFEQLEGLELIRLILDMNGYYPLEIVRREGQLRLKMPVPGEVDMDEYRLAPKYILFTGVIDRDIREANILMYRGDFGRLNEGLQEDIKAIYGESEDEGGYESKNRHGEIVRVLLITAAGAEGLNLQNVRQVHIFEPYWNRVRLEQVYGRAIRYCSHAFLPQEEREVSRYLYVSSMTDSQKEMMFKEEIFRSDVIVDPRDVKGLGILSTTDEMILDLARRKDAISRQFVKLMKEVSFDCAIHQGIGVGTSQVCYSIPKTMNIPERLMLDDENVYFRQKRYIVPPDWKMDFDEATDGKMDIQEIVWSPQVIRLPEKGKDTEIPRKYILRQDTGELYDYNLGKGFIFEKIGRIEREEDGDYVAVLEDDIPEITGEKIPEIIREEIREELPEEISSGAAAAATTSI